MTVLPQWLVFFANLDWLFEHAVHDQSIKTQGDEGRNSAGKQNACGKRGKISNMQWAQDEICTVLAVFNVHNNGKNNGISLGLNQGLLVEY